MKDEIGRPVILSGSIWSACGRATALGGRRKRACVAAFDAGASRHSREALAGAQQVVTNLQLVPNLKKRWPCHAHSIAAISSQPLSRQAGSRELRGFSKSRNTLGPSLFYSSQPDGS